MILWDKHSAAIIIGSYYHGCKDNEADAYQAGIEVAELIEIALCLDERTERIKNILRKER